MNAFADWNIVKKRIDFEIRICIFYVVRVSVFCCVVDTTVSASLVCIEVIK